MQKQSAPVCAAIDIGSNTIRIVVAHCQPEHLDILAADEALVRIGESVNATGSISPQKADEAIATLRRFKAVAEQYAANPIFAIATEAIRKAANKDEFLAAIQSETGITVQLIDGDIEATLTFYGATYGLQKEQTSSDPIGVMDLGGGSTELLIARNMQISWRTSVPVGSGWILDRYFTDDPPSADDIVVARAFLQTYFKSLSPKQVPHLLIATGGSANALLLLAQRAFELDPSLHFLTHDDLVRCEGLLCALPAEEVARRYQLAAQRARMLAAGSLILRTIMERFRLSEIHVNTHGIREGVLLAFARYGSSWLQAVEQKSELIDDTNTIEVGETFAQAGRRALREQAEKMLDWREEVLKNEDIEAVHKMRVASRRLRAVLDAYQSVCQPKIFKKLYRVIKQTADVLGEARDTDVMIESLRVQIEHASDEERPGLQWLVDHVNDYRQEQQQPLARSVGQLDKATFMQQIDACLSEGGLRDGKS